MEGALFLVLLVVQLAAVFYYLFLAREHPTRVSVPDPDEDLDSRLAPPEEIRSRRAEIARTNRIAAPLGFFVAGGLLVGSAYAAWDVLELRAIGEREEGTVVGYDQLRTGLAPPVYRAMVSFTPVAPAPLGASPLTFTDRFGSTRPHWQTGDRVTVLSDPENPVRAQIDAGPAGNLIFAALLGLAGLVVLRMSVVAFGTLRGGKGRADG